MAELEMSELDKQFRIKVEPYLKEKGKYKGPVFQLESKNETNPTFEDQGNVLQVVRTHRDEEHIQGIAQGIGRDRDKASQVTETKRDEGHRQDIAQGIGRDLKDDKDLQNYLIKLYEENIIQRTNTADSDDNQTITDDIYVTPSMDIVEERVYPLSTIQRKNCEVQSYLDIFKPSCRRIYVVGNAGVGKTALCKQMLAEWCKVHTKKRRNDKLTNDQQAMLRFDFLFYISLRHALSESRVEDMIKHQLITDECHYASVSSLLKSDRCLIVLDGLDEWTPPRYCQIVNFGLPCKVEMSKCTILTTTRPWKIEILRFASSEIDMQVELKGLNEKSAHDFIEHIVTRLNKTSHKSMSTEQFYLQLKEKKIAEFKSIPILLQLLVGLWIEGESICLSKCELYCSLLSLQLQRTNSSSTEYGYMKKLENQTKTELPKCFELKPNFKEFKPLLYSIARMAFSCLFGQNKESSLVFDRAVGDKYGLSEMDLKICLNIGILSQSKTAVCSPVKMVSFIHKTFQEFLAALYITLAKENLQECATRMRSILQVLELSNVLVFISGMNPAAANHLIDHVWKLTSEDHLIKKYRETTEDDSYIYTTNMISQVNKMITECVTEGLHSGFSDISLLLADVFIQDDYTTQDVDNLLRVKVDTIRSLHVEVDRPLPEQLLRLLLKSKYLQKLGVYGNVISMENIGDLVSNSKQTLQSLTLSCLTFQMLNMNLMPQPCFCSMLDDLSKLVAIRFQRVNLRHNQLVYLTKFLSQKHDLEQIQLEKLRQSDTADKIDFELDLSNHSKLQTLSIERMVIDHVMINTENLERIEIVLLQKRGIASIALNHIRAAAKLRHFRCGIGKVKPDNRDVDALIELVPTLERVQTIEIVYTSFKKKEFKLSPQMIKLEIIELRFVEMTDTAFCSFVDSIPKRQPIKVRVNMCFSKPMIDYVKTCGHFIVTQERKDDRISGMIYLSFENNAL